MLSVAEEWRAIPGFEGLYEVSSEGRIRSLNRTVVDAIGRTYHLRGRDMTPSKHTGGYRFVRLNSGGTSKPEFVHSIVAAAFIGQRPDGLDVNHIDGRKDNNAARNLEYVTRKGNMDHAWDTGLCDNRGENNGQAKATADQVRRGHALMQQGMSVKQAAAESGLTISVLESVREGRRWKSLNLPRLTKTARSKPA